MYVLYVHNMSYVFQREREGEHVNACVHMCASSYMCGWVSGSDESSGDLENMY